MSALAPEERLLRTAEVARLLHVRPRTVILYAQKGMVPSLRTPGGHRRYPEVPILALAASMDQPAVGGATPPGR